MTRMRESAPMILRPQAWTCRECRAGPHEMGEDLPLVDLGAGKLAEQVSPQYGSSLQHDSRDPNQRNMQRHDQGESCCIAVNFAWQEQPR